MSALIDLVKRELEANGFTDKEIVVGRGRRESSVVIVWQGNVLAALDVGTVGTEPVVVAAVANSARGRTLARVLLDIADDEYEPYTEDATTNTPVADAKDAGERMAAEADLESGDPRQG